MQLTSRSWLRPWSVTVTIDDATLQVLSVDIVTSSKAIECTIGDDVLVIRPLINRTISRDCRSLNIFATREVSTRRDETVKEQIHWRHRIIADGVS
jgi:hypothetical protein